MSMHADDGDDEETDPVARQDVLLLDLRDDAAAIAAYRDWHRPGGPPAAVIAAIRRSGITDMRIYLDGNRLVMLMTVDDRFDAAAKAAADRADPAVMRWEALMDTLQQALPFAPAGVKWVPAEPIFALEDQPPGDGEG